MKLNTLRKEPHIFHFTLDEAAAMLQKLGVPVVYLTLISHQLGRHKQIDENLPKVMPPAFNCK